MLLTIKKMQLLNHKCINFSLPENSVTLIHGPNGCGKSLFLKSLARLEECSFEEFRFREKDIDSYYPEEYRSQVLYVPGQTYNLDMSTEEFLKYPQQLAIYKNQNLGNESFELAKGFGLDVQTLHLLSMGQRQLLNLIRALHLKAKVLLLDEPTSNLDPAMTREAEKLILSWKEENQGSLILVSHDTNQSERMGVRSLWFEDLVQKK
jgi:putative ABC transport system ATP-binding protein